MTTTDTHAQPAEMATCIDNCITCHQTCTATAIHCLDMGGAHAGRDHQRLLADCAQICITSADFMLRGSEFHSATCAACAEICEHCADECERMADGDEAMKACADACRRCADSCREMAGL